MLSGEGSLKAGGRWNAPGAFPAIYSSLVHGQERLAKKHFSSPPTFSLSPTI
jgi:RES domain-containing protein